MNTPSANQDSFGPQLKLQSGDMTANFEKFSFGGDPILVIDDGTGEESVLSIAEARALRDWLNQVLT